MQGIFSKDKTLYIILGVLILVVLMYRNIKDYRDVPNEVGTRNVLPVNEDKKLVDPKEVRQYVGAIAEREGLNIDRVDKVVKCESHFDVKARSRTGKYLGIWQISRIHNVSDECRLDAVCSTKWAVEKIKRDGNMLAWECSVI